MSSSSKHYSDKTNSRSTQHSHLNSLSASSSSSVPPSVAASGGRRRPSGPYWDTVLAPLSIGDSSHVAGPSKQRAITKTISRACPKCKHVFSTTRSFEEHIKLCTPDTEKPYVCDECNTAFKKNSNLVKHKKLVHLGERKFACDEPGCERMFGQRSNLNSHVRAVHLGEKPFICTEDNCGRRFSQKSGLKAHVKTVHKGERPYRCECGSAFGHRGDLNRHIRVLHEKQRPYECTICPDRKAFGRRSVLQRHMATHTARERARAQSVSSDSG